MIVHDVVRSSCGPEAVNIECPLPSARQSADTTNVASDDSMDLEWKENIERRISVYVPVTDCNINCVLFILLVIAFMTFCYRIVQISTL